jgi:hypothetical protein
MTHYAIYNIETGEVVQTGSAPESQMGAMGSTALDGQGFIAKEINPKTHRVSANGRIIKKRSKDVDAQEVATAARKLRSMRAALLAQSDWTQMPDAPVDQVAWREYRQALRDLPANTPDPHNIDWPEAPK